MSLDSTHAAEGVPEYTVRESARARRVRLVVSAREGLVVVTPRGFSAARVAPIVASKAEWARRALLHVAERRALYAGGSQAMLPAEVGLGATGERFTVLRLPTHASGVRAVERGNVIELRGAVDDADACLAALNRWLGAAAKARLLPALEALAAEYGFTYSSARIKKQRSRWGSCSARGTVSLNRTLVFLPPQLVRAVMLHELAHTRRLDHSAAFWAELSELDPHVIEHRAALREAGDLVPPWADV